MKTRIAILAAAASAAMCAGAAGRLSGRQLKVSADKMAADNATGTLVATGNVVATLSPFKMTSSYVAKNGDTYEFRHPTCVTSCTNENGCLHWSMTGDVKLRDLGGHKEVEARDMTLRLWNIPVMYVPYWWQPLDTDWGWRVVPGYRSRWGAYLLTKYVYRIAGGFEEGQWGLSGNTRFDLRAKNGAALGQSLRWQLGDWGRGKFKVYHAWDEDADRYDRHWNSRRRWHYSNWGSTVPDERYGLMFEHSLEPTERDRIRARAAYYSDSHFRSDFLKDVAIGLDNRYLPADRNELAWEHLENTFGFGLSVAGPLNDFYGGTARLPEFHLSVMPQKIWTLPANYESSSRIGWLNREYAKHGKSSTALPYRYDPGRWADYQAFRFDTYHRFTTPFKVADVLSVVPRIGLRGTFWSDSGSENLDGVSRAGRQDDPVLRSIVEGGATFAARGVADFDGKWRHIFEPYADVLAQQAQYSGLRRGARGYLFDGVDGSQDWLDQFAGASRNLPYSWHGVVPGVRNAFRKIDENGSSKPFFDLDFYAAVQFNDTTYTDGDRFHRLSRNQENPNYGRSSKATAAPGVRAKWTPKRDSTLALRTEWDGQNDRLAYANASWREQVSKGIAFTSSFSARDQRWWDFSSTPYDPSVERNEDFNWTRFTYAGLGLEHEICDTFAWGPYVRWDLRENELDEAGAWFDIRTDCLGLRFSFAYENDYRRIDGSEHKDDWRFNVSVYLRAFGPSAGTLFGK